MNLKEVIGNSWTSLITLNEKIDHDGIENLMIDLNETLICKGHLTRTESRTITNEETFPELEKIKLIMQEVIDEHNYDPISTEGKPFVVMGIEWLKAYGIEFNKLNRIN